MKDCKEIIFDKVVPKPIEELDYSHSQVWDQQLKLDTSKRILIRSSSGMGKTTLLSIIYGIRHDYRGTVTFDGQDARKLNGRAWTQLRNTGFSHIFQGLRLFGDLNLMDNIFIKNRLTEYKTEEEIIAMVERTGLGIMLKKPAKFLSFGQRQRVALIRALSQPFKFLLLDEPFSHLDADNQKILCQMIHEECEKQEAGLVLTSLGEHYFIDYNEKIML